MALAHYLAVAGIHRGRLNPLLERVYDLIALAGFLNPATPSTGFMSGGESGAPPTGPGLQPASTIPAAMSLALGWLRQALPPDS